MCLKNIFWISLWGGLALTAGAQTTRIHQATIKTVTTTLDEKNRIATIRFVVEVKSREQMDKVVKQLMKKSDVIDVFRA